MDWGARLNVNFDELDKEIEDHLAAHWRRYSEFRPAFIEAMDPRFANIAYLDALLLSGRAKAWFGDNSAIVAEIRTLPSGAMAVCGVIAAGDQKEIEELIPQAEAWGRGRGCRYGMIESRHGWEKVMKKHGYEPFQVSIVKEL